MNSRSYLLVLPAHNDPFKKLGIRTDFLLKNHEDHLDELIRAWVEGRASVELVPLMFNRKLNSIDWIFALGECLAHPRCLMGRGRLTRRENADGVYQYHSHNSSLLPVF